MNRSTLHLRADIVVENVKEACAGMVERTVIMKAKSILVDESRGSIAPFAIAVRMDWEMKRKVGTSLRMRSYVALSRVTACCALSLTFPFDHFFFLAALPPDEAAAAFALACWKRESIKSALFLRLCAIHSRVGQSIPMIPLEHDYFLPNAMYAMHTVHQFIIMIENIHSPC